ncbi:MAG: hypothetical protein K2X81_13885 [Candidatus Obscuribacterales bacterium]|nr:hypothetical protein [Candidatus Obscuribacterales bacterium]
MDRVTDDNKKAEKEEEDLPSLSLYFSTSSFDMLLHQIETSKPKADSEKKDSAKSEEPAQAKTEQIKSPGGYWQKSEKGWQSVDESGTVRKSAINTADISTVDKQANGSVRLTLKDGISYTEKNDGSVLKHSSDGKLQEIKYADASVRKLEWDGEELRKMSSPDGKTIERVSKDGKYSDQWKLPDSNLWAGKISINEKTGDCAMNSPTWPESGMSTVVHSDGSREELQADRTKSIKYKNGDQVSFDRNGRASSLTTADGVKREFSGWSLDLKTGKEELTTIKVTTAANKTVSEWQLKNNQWETAGAEPGQFVFNVNSRTGQYSFRDNDTAELKRFTPGKAKESNMIFGKEELIKTELSDNRSSIRTEDGSFSVDLDKGLSKRIVEDKQERFITRNDKGQVTEIKDPNTNTLWKQNEKSEWVGSSLNSSMPFKNVDANLGKSKLLVDSLGLCSFITADGNAKKLNMDGSIGDLSAEELVRTKLNASDNIQPEGKQRLSESVKMLECRDDISRNEKDKSFNEMLKLIDSKVKSSYSQSDRETIAAQALWHMARPTRQEQGQHSTCNVTTVRSTLMHQSPSTFARMISEIGTTDKFKTADGSMIDLPASMTQILKSESNFPPSGGARSWLGHISDVAMANIYWQRQTVDTFGLTVPKGSIKYTDNEPQYNGDSGERLHKYLPDGRQHYELRERTQNVVARSPELYPANILDIMGQITGRDEKGRVIAHKAHYSDEAGKVALVDNEVTFAKAISEGPWPKIITVHTSQDPFWNDSGSGTAGGAGGRAGGWHVVVATGLDKNTNSIAIDNSWQPERDHNANRRRISLKNLFQATTGPKK